jgi:hypothetical protein
MFKLVSFFCMLESIILDRVESNTDLGVWQCWNFWKDCQVSQRNLGPFMCQSRIQSFSTQDFYGGLFMMCTSVGLSVCTVSPLNTHCGDWDGRSCTIFHLKTLTWRRSNACLMFVFEVLYILLFLVSVIARCGYLFGFQLSKNRFFFIVWDQCCVYCVFSLRDNVVWIPTTFLRSMGRIFFVVSIYLR